MAMVLPPPSGVSSSFSWNSGNATGTQSAQMSTSAPFHISPRTGSSASCTGQWPGAMVAATSPRRRPPLCQPPASPASSSSRRTTRVPGCGGRLRFRAFAVRLPCYFVVRLRLRMRLFFPLTHRVLIKLFRQPLLDDNRSLRAMAQARAQAVA